MLGQPFELSMQYSSPQAPTSYVWLKNGYMFEGDGERVRVDHTGIAFSRVRAQDAGLYQVVARYRTTTGRAFTVLKGSALCVQCVLWTALAEWWG